MRRQLVYWLTPIVDLTARVPAPAYPASFPSTTVSPMMATAIPSQTSIPTAVNTQTYHDTVVGFESDYPQGWLIDTSNEASGTVILWTRKVEGSGVDGVPADVENFDIVNPAVTVKSLAELVTWEEQIIADTSNTIVHETQLQLTNGQAAGFLQGTKADEQTALLTLVNNQALTIAGFGDVSRFMDITLTFRAVPPTSSAASTNPDLVSIYCGHGPAYKSGVLS